MKGKKLLFLSSASIGTLILIIFLILTTKAKINASEKIDYLKKTFNMELSINHNKDKINKSSAYEIAEKHTQTLSVKAKNVFIEHYYLTFNELLPAAFNIGAIKANPRLENGINKMPVWIVAYEGVKSSGRSLPESKVPPKPTITVITVIDSTTGEVIFQVGGS